MNQEGAGKKFLRPFLSAIGEGEWEGNEGRKKKVVLGTDLTGEMAVVTDTGKILCGMLVRTLVRTGVAVALLDINLGAAEEIARDTREAGGTAAAYGMDVMGREMLESVHARVLTWLGPCGILISGTGGSQVKANTSKKYFETRSVEADVATSFDMEYEDIQGMLDLDFLGGFLTCQVSVKDMVGREGYNIINISSTSATRPLTRVPVHDGTVAAFGNFTQWLVVHFAKVGIRVNVIAPGFFVTRQNEGLLYNEDEKPTARIAKVLAAIPMERFGKPEGLGGVLMFLLDNEVVGFITGIILPVDGRFSTYSGA